MRNACIALRLCGTAALLAAAGASAGAAEPVDAQAAFKTKVLKCLHPTASPDKATYETVKPAETAGDTTTTRVKVFCAGTVGGKDALEADLLVRRAGSIRRTRVDAPSDSGSSSGKCGYTAGWTDF